jgi:predicted molibdopterin-dependent oxidoreductase YjgC
MKINLTINGQKIQADAGKTILQVAVEAGIDIPILCHHPALPPEGACRICLVEIERQRSLQPACTFPATEGLVVHTHSPKVIEARRFVLEMLLSDHPFDCMTCDATGDCLLQDLVYEYGVKTEETPGLRHQYPIDDPNPFIQVDLNKCILCTRCVRACTYINGVEAISVVHRGFKARIAFGGLSHMMDSPCEFCGSCVAVCPTAALYPKISLGKGRTWQVQRVPTVCSYCGVGCQLVLEVKDNRIVKVDALTQHENTLDGSGGATTPNHGWTCVKGRFGYDYVHHPDRLTRPKVRRYILEGTPKPEDRGEWVEVDWDTALEVTARRLVHIYQETNPASSTGNIGVMTSAKCTNEENYLMNKLARQALGTNTIDHCARL